MDGDRNVGDAAVLALAQTLPARAVIDDRDACDIASKEGVALSRTLNLLCEAIRSRLLTVDFVSEVADELIRTEYRLPFDPGDFENMGNQRESLSVVAHRRECHMVRIHGVDEERVDQPGPFSS